MSREQKCVRLVRTRVRLLVNVQSLARCIHARRRMRIRNSPAVSFVPLLMRSSWTDSYRLDDGHHARSLSHPKVARDAYATDSRSVSRQTSEQQGANPQPVRCPVVRPVCAWVPQVSTYKRPDNTLTSPRLRVSDANTLGRRLPAPASPRSASRPFSVIADAQDTVSPAAG
jgi:hypothetical protein